MKQVPMISKRAEPLFGAMMVFIATSRIVHFYFRSRVLLLTNNDRANIELLNGRELFKAVSAPS